MTEPVCILCRAGVVTAEEADAALRALGEAMANQVLNENEPDAEDQRAHLAAATFAAATVVRQMILRRAP